MPEPRPQPLWRIPENTTDEGRLWLHWLVRLRWVAIIAQIVTLAFAARLLASPVLILPLVAVIAALVVGNLRASARLRRPGTVSNPALLLQLGLDVLALTAFFLLAGGPDNPFTPLYFIHVAMASVMLRARLAMGLAAFVVACFGLLHPVHIDLDLAAHSLDPDTLVGLGRGVAFLVTALSITGFVVGLASALRVRERQLLEARDRTARTDRLRSVGTLAAGAAHELNTPLSTIGLRIRRIGRRHGDADTAKDVRTVREQLDRCSRVVDQLLVGAGDPAASHLERRPLAQLVEDGLSLWAKGNDVRVELEDVSDGLEVELPRIAFTQALVNLLENAREAQIDVDAHRPIEVRVSREEGEGVVRVRDHGIGLPDTPDRIGEPFYTTKDTGTGLGVFVARAVADGAGGGLRYTKGDGTYTEAIWWFPEAQRRSG